jgi:hypothetical protein
MQHVSPVIIRFLHQNSPMVVKWSILSLLEINFSVYRYKKFCIVSMSSDR